MINSYVFNRGPAGVRSPADRLFGACLAVRNFMADRIRSGPRQPISESPPDGPHAKALDRKRETGFRDNRHPGYADARRRVWRAMQTEYTGLSTLSWADQ